MKRRGSCLSADERKQLENVVVSGLGRRGLWVLVLFLDGVLVVVNLYYDMKSMMSADVQDVYPRTKVCPGPVSL